MNEEISTSCRQEASPASSSLPPTTPVRDPPHLPPSSAHLPPSSSPLPAHLLPSSSPLPSHLPPEREPPSWKSLLTGIFLSDHFSWIFEPSSAGMIFFSYYLLRYCESSLPSDWSIPFVLWTPNVALYWSIASSFLALDWLTEESGKRFKRRSKVKTSSIVKTVFRNHAFTVVVATIATRGIQSWLAVEWLETSNDSVTWILFSVFVNGFIFEVIFWIGHFLEHVSPFMYSKFHLLHHTTKADVSFSGYYMTLLDFCFEALFPMWGCLAATIAFRLSSVALLHNVMLNFVYAATVHSGWALPGFPDPNEHWIHHTKVAPRGNGVNYGGHFNLMDRVMNTHQDYDNNNKINLDKIQ